METMNEKSDLVVASIFGRGNWLALECARRGWDVTLLDLTPKGAEANPENREGPWGFFDGRDLLPTQRDHLLTNAQVFPVGSGFTIWLPRGPLELTGPLADFQTHAYSLPEDVLDYLTEPASQDQALTATSELPKTDRPVWISRLTLKGLREPDAMKGREGLRRKIQTMPFEKSWLANLSHTLASPVMLGNTEAISFGAPLSLRASYGVRHLTPENIEASVKTLEEAGVRVRKLEDIYDVRVQSGHFESIVIDQDGDIEAGRAFVWMLTSGETARFHERITRSLYPAGYLNPAYFWTKFQFQLDDVSSAKSLPLAFVINESPFLPWSHSNLLVVKRLRNNGQGVPIELWLRAPIRVIGDKAYFENLRDECAQILSTRIPQSNPVASALPEEATDGSAGAVHAVRFPIFSRDEFSKLKTTSATNFFSSSPEQWEAFDWNSQMRYQAAVFAALERLRAHWENVERKREREATT